MEFDNNKEINVHHKKNPKHQLNLSTVPNCKTLKIKHTV